MEDYEENDLVLSTIHILMIFFEKDTCNCRHTTRQKDLRSCYEKVGFKCFFERHLELSALEKNELELFIKAQLLTFKITFEEVGNRHNYRFNFNN